MLVGWGGGLYAFSLTVYSSVLIVKAGLARGEGGMMENNIWKYGVRTPGGQEENKLFFWSQASFFVATKL